MSFITAMSLAKYIINKCIDDDCPVSNLQLQKILYYIQVRFLQATGRVAFDDDIEAWKFGPVVSDVYYKYCGFGASPINIKYQNVEINDENHKAVVDEVIKAKQNLPPWALVTDTHMPGKAWSRAYNTHGSYSKIKIQDMKRYG